MDINTATIINSTLQAAAVIIGGGILHYAKGILTTLKEVKEATIEHHVQIETLKDQYKELDTRIYNLQRQSIK